MNKLKTLLASCALILAFNTPAMSDSSNFAGPYIGLQASSIGAGVGGKKTGGVDDVNESTVVSAGKSGVVAGLEAGYAIPLGSSLLLDIGGSYIDGTVSLRHSSDDVADSGDVKFQASQFYTYYVAPTIVLSDTSSLFVKFGQQEATVDVTGDVTNPGDLEGTTYAVGTRTVLDSGIFIRAEAGYTEFDALNASGAGVAQGGIPTTTKYVADPEIAYGAISLGFRF
jgi:hypothetical protein